MKSRVVLSIGLAAALTVASSALAQTAPSKAQVAEAGYTMITATVVKVDLKTRAVELRDERGKAFTISVLTGSGTPITAAIPTEGCLSRQSSISAGPILYPELVMTSSFLPTNQKYPSGSFLARSPVHNQSPINFSVVASGFPQYSKNITGSGL